jgi:hypothetical protein
MKTKHYLNSENNGEKDQFDIGEKILTFMYGNREFKPL